MSISTNTSIASSILADALETLEFEHRETIRILLQPTHVVNAEDTFNEVHAYARELQQRSKIERWSWDYRGRQIYLFEQADKVVRLLDRFKAVGDIDANVDPVHKFMTDLTRMAFGTPMFSRRPDAGYNSLPSKFH